MTRALHRFLPAILAVACLTTGYAGARYLDHESAAAVTARTAVSFSGTETSALDQGTVTYPASLSFSQAFANGTGAAQASVQFCDTRTTSARDSMDLSGGNITGAFGVSTFATVKGIIITAASANAGNVVVGGAAATTFTGPFSDATDKIVVKPGGAFAIIVPGTGYTVTNTSADAFVVASSSGSVTYSMCLLGT